VFCANADGRSIKSRRPIHLSFMYLSVKKRGE
jgi:hypothetical protein